MFNWCFIGSGKLAKKVAKEITSSHRHNIVSVYSRNYESASKFANKFNAKAYTNAIDAINDKNVDAVYIVTPHNSHYMYAKLALQNKKPCLVEKPFTTNIEDAKDLFKIAKENNVYIAEAMWTWFCKTSYIVKDSVLNKTIGEIQKAYGVFGFIGNKKSRLFDPKRAGGALLDVGIYPITYFYRIFSYPKKISCRGIIKNGVDVYEEIKLDYDNISIVCESYISKRLPKNYILIKGSKGKIISHNFNSSGKATINNKTIKNNSNYLNEFDLVSKEIINGKKESEYVPQKCTLDVLSILFTCLSILNSK